MKKFKSNFVLLFALIGITGACIGTGIYAYTSANADKLELLNRAVANDAVNELQTTRSDIKIAVSIWGGHSGAIIDNSLYMWGENDKGQLGLGNTDRKDTPQRVTTNIPTGTITHLALGYKFSGAVVDNQLYMWGMNDEGQLARGKDIWGGAISTPNLVVGLPEGTITQFALGSAHSGAVIDNKLFMWGDSYYGQLGNGSSDSVNSQTPSPRQVTINIPAGPITKLALGGSYTGAVIDNKLFMWGNRNVGQLGDGSYGWGKANTPRFVDLDTFGISGTITQLALGYNHSGVIINNQLYMWGNNDQSQLGFANSDSKDFTGVPTPVPNMPSGTITQLALGLDYSSVVANGELYMWGKNESGQLGFSNETITITPSPVPGISGKITQLALGYKHSGAVVNNQLYIWGDNQKGQLGINNITQQNSPIPVNSINTYDSSTPIILDATNDKDNLRDKMASEIANGDLTNLTSLIQQSSDKFAINLPLDATKYTIKNIDISPITIDGINKEQISFDLTTPAYDQGNVTSTNTLSFSKVTIQGFTPFVEPEKPVEPPVEPDKPIPPVEQPDQPVGLPKNDNTWLIVGLSLGGVGLIGIIGTIFLIKRRHK